MKLGNKVKILSVKDSFGRNMWDDELVGKSGIIMEVDVNHPYDKEPLYIQIDNDESGLYGFFPEMLEEK